MPDAVTGTWVPDPERVAATNVARLMRRHGIAGLAELRRRSVEDTSWYWDAVVDDLGIPFSVPYERVVDERAGAPWARWFAGGQVNVAHACVDRWRDDPQSATASIPSPLKASSSRRTSGCAPGATQSGTTTPPRSRAAAGRPRPAPKTC